MKRFFLLTFLLLLSLPAAAQIRTFIGPTAGLFGFELPVAADGTVFLERNVPGGGIELAAIKANGEEKWTHKLTRGVSAVKLNDFALVVTFIEFSQTSLLAPKTRFAVLSLETGAELVESTIEGTIASITPHREGFYLLAMIPDGPAPGMRPGAFLQKRRLLSVDNFGNKRWELAVD